MEHRDAQISAIVVVNKSAYGDKTLELVERLQVLGMSIENVNDDQGWIEGCIETIRVREIEVMIEVETVRTVSTYIADYPAGDPRDKDEG